MLLIRSIALISQTRRVKRLDVVLKAWLNSHFVYEDRNMLSKVSR